MLKITLLSTYFSNDWLGITITSCQISKVTIIVRPFLYILILFKDKVGGLCLMMNDPFDSMLCKLLTFCSCGWISRLLHP
jgi:hypothetical protein